MDASFWHNRWQTNQTGWHERDINPLLITHFPSLHIPQGSRVFVPLCGKSLDLGWLLVQGYAVVGAELSDLAVTQLFAELGMRAQISDLGKHRHFHGEKIDIFVGDLFDLSHEILGPVEGSSAIQSLSWSPDGSSFLATSADGIVRQISSVGAILEQSNFTGVNAMPFFSTLCARLKAMISWRRFW